MTTTISQADFTAWLRTYPQWSTTVLPDASVFITDAYSFAVATVNPQIGMVDAVSYRLATYCLGASYIINWDPDAFFAALRTDYKIDAFAAGVVSGASDEGTSTTLAVPDALKALNVGDLGLLKDTWGRQYVALAQKVGSLWGVT